MARNPRDLFPPSLKTAAATVFGTASSAATLLQQPSAAGTELSFPPGWPLDAALLHPREATKVAAFQLPKRRMEFLTGRICAKLALEKLWTANGRKCPCPLNKIEIDNTASGRPIVAIDGPAVLPLPEISITHGGRYAAALAAQVPCGIDLQQHRANLLRVREKYCVATEEQFLEEFLPDTPAIARLSLLWAAKEAAKKTLSSLQMPGFLELELKSPATLLPEGCSFTLAVRVGNNTPMPPNVTVLTTLFGEYALAVCLLQKDPYHA